MSFGKNSATIWISNYSMPFNISRGMNILEVIFYPYSNLLLLTPYSRLVGMSSGSASVEINVEIFLKKKK